jgi:hypothetical protein
MSFPEISSDTFKSIAAIYPKTNNGLLVIGMSVTFKFYAGICWTHYKRLLTRRITRNVKSSSQKILRDCLLCKIVIASIAAGCFFNTMALSPGLLKNVEAVAG